MTSLLTVTAEDLKNAKQLIESDGVPSVFGLDDANRLCVRSNEGFADPFFKNYLLFPVEKDISLKILKLIALLNANGATDESISKDTKTLTSARVLLKTIAAAELPDSDATASSALSDQFEKQFNKLCKEFTDYVISEMPEAEPHRDLIKKAAQHILFITLVYTDSNKADCAIDAAIDELKVRLPQTLPNVTVNKLKDLLKFCANNLDKVGTVYNYLFALSEPFQPAIRHMYETYETRLQEKHNIALRAKQALEVADWLQDMPLTPEVVKDIILNGLMACNSYIVTSCRYVSLSGNARFSPAVQAWMETHTNHDPEEVDDTLRRKVYRMGSPLIDPNSFFSRRGFGWMVWRTSCKVARTDLTADEKISGCSRTTRMQLGQLCVNATGLTFIKQQTP